MKDQEDQEVVHLARGIQLQEEIDTQNITPPGVDLGTEVPHRQTREEKVSPQLPKQDHPKEIHHHLEKESYLEAHHLINTRNTLLNTEKVSHQREEKVSRQREEKVSHQRDIPIHQEGKVLRLRKTTGHLLAKKIYLPRGQDPQRKGNIKAVFHHQERCHITHHHHQTAWTQDTLQTFL